MTSKTLIAAFVGTLIIHVSAVAHVRLEAQHAYPLWLTLAEVFREVGLAFIVAAVVSALYDLQYHERTFVKPLVGVEGKVRELAATVIGLNQVMEAAQRFNIVDILRRRESPEREVWKHKMKATVAESTEFLLIVARTLDDLLPAKNRASGLAQELQTALRRKVGIVVLLANTFDDETEFRQECKRRTEPGHSPGLLYGPTRDTVRQFLSIVRADSMERQLSLKLLNRAPPFALFMNERRTIVEPYLPYVEGGEGLVIEIEHAGRGEGLSDRPGVLNPVSEAYFASTKALYECAEDVAPVLRRYVTRHADRSDQYQHHLNTADAMARHAVVFRTTSPRLQWNAATQPSAPSDDAVAEPDRLTASASTISNPI